ncbi:MAG: TonB family protein [Terriglobia bacterium]
MMSVGELESKPHEISRRLSSNCIIVALVLVSGRAAPWLAAHPASQLAQQQAYVSPAPTAFPSEEAERHLIEKVEPTYPPLARMAGIEGLVRLQVIVSPDGKVLRTVQTSGDPLLVRAASAAAEKYTYRPFIENGKAVPSIFWIEIDFTLPRYKPHSVPFPEVKDYRSVVITMDTGDYSLRIVGDGTVEFEGRGFVLLPGKHHGAISGEEFRKLVEDFRDSDFFSLDDRYYLIATDVVSTTVSIAIGSQRKSVTAGSPGAPSALLALERSVDKLTHSDQWVKGTAETIPGVIRENRSAADTKEILSKALPAAVYSTTAVVSDILRAGANVDQTDSEGCTALMRAAERGMPDMVQLLLRADANPRTKDKSARTALMFAATSGNSSVVALLLHFGMVKARSRRGSTALMAAAAAGNPDVVQMLLHAGARVNDHDAMRVAALFAGSTGDLDSIWDGELVGRPHPEVPDEVVHRDAVVRLLLEAGADPNARNKDGESALFSLEDDAVRELIAHKIDLNVRNNNGETALIETVSVDIAKLLVAAGADVNAQDSKGRTALLQAANNNNSAKIRAVTAAKHVQIDRRGRDGRTALMIAAGDASPECVRALLEGQADPTLRDKQGRTALQIAEAGLSSAREGYKIDGYKKSIDLLRHAGTNP